MKLDADAQSVDEAPVGMEFARAVLFARISWGFLCVTHSNCNGVAVSVGWLIKVSFGLLASGPPFTKAGDEAVVLIRHAIVSPGCQQQNCQPHPALEEWVRVALQPAARRLTWGATWPDVACHTLAASTHETPCSIEYDLSPLPCTCLSGQQGRWDCRLQFCCKCSQAAGVSTSARR